MPCLLKSQEILNVSWAKVRDYQDILFTQSLSIGQFRNCELSKASNEFLELP